MQDIINVIIKDPGDKARKKTMVNTLKELQYEVGGLINVVYLGDIDGILMIVNEEGKLKGLGVNFTLYNDIIIGTAVFIGGAEGEEGREFRGLTDEEIEIVYKIIEGNENCKAHKNLVDKKLW